VGRSTPTGFSASLCRVLVSKRQPVLASGTAEATRGEGGRVCGALICLQRLSCKEAIPPVDKPRVAISGRVTKSTPRNGASKMPATTLIVMFRTKKQHFWYFRVNTRGLPEGFIRDLLL
jgi:hypothetical protein